MQSRSKYATKRARHRAFRLLSPHLETGTWMKWPDIKLLNCILFSIIRTKNGIMNVFKK